MKHDPFKLTPQGINLLKRVASHIEKHASEFNMADWDCGTRACIAGHIGRMIGRPILHSMDPIARHENGQAVINAVFVNPVESLAEVPLFIYWDRDECLDGLDSFCANPRVAATAIRRYIEAHS